MINFTTTLESYGVNFILNSKSSDESVYYSAGDTYHSLYYKELNAGDRVNPMVYDNIATIFCIKNNVTYPIYICRYFTQYAIGALSLFTDDGINVVSYRTQLTSDYPNLITYINGTLTLTNVNLSFNYSYGTLNLTNNSNCDFNINNKLLSKNSNINVNTNYIEISSPSNFNNQVTFTNVNNMKDILYNTQTINNFPSTITISDLSNTVSMSGVDDKEVTINYTNTSLPIITDTN